MDDTITIRKSELKAIVTAATQEILKELGIKAKPVESDWISKNQAIQISREFGRKKLEKAILLGIVRKKPVKSHDNPYQRQLVSRKDVENCIKQCLV